MEPSLLPLAKSIYYVAVCYQKHRTFFSQSLKLVTTSKRPHLVSGRIPFLDWQFVDFPFFIKGAWLALGSLSNDVFERRASTGSELLELLGRDFEKSLVQVVFTRVTTLSNTNLAALRHIKREKGSVPVGVRHPKTALLKLPIIYTWTVADPGEGLGPLLLSDQTKARRAEKKNLETALAHRYLKVRIRHCMNVPDNRDGGSWNLLTFLMYDLCFRELFYAFYLAGMKSVWSMTFWHLK